MMGILVIKGFTIFIKKLHRRYLKEFKYATFQTYFKVVSPLLFGEKVIQFSFTEMITLFVLIFARINFHAAKEDFFRVY